MTHLVMIGQSGQVARELALLQLPPGWRLTSLDRSKLDLAEPNSFRAILEPLSPDVIINAAGYTAVQIAKALLQYRGQGHHEWMWSDDERTIFIIVSGDTVPSGRMISPGPGHTAVPPTVCG